MVIGAEDTGLVANCATDTEKSASKLMLLGHQTMKSLQSSKMAFGIGIAIETMASASVVKAGTHAFARTMTISSDEHRTVSRSES